MKSFGRAFSKARSGSPDGQLGACLVVIVRQGSVAERRQATRCLFSFSCLTGLGEYCLAEPYDHRLAELGEHRLA